MLSFFEKKVQSDIKDLLPLPQLFAFPPRWLACFHGATLMGVI